jgi:hypothetical protein
MLQQVETILRRVERRVRVVPKRKRRDERCRGEQDKAKELHVRGRRGYRLVKLACHQRYALYIAASA